MKACLFKLELESKNIEIFEVCFDREMDLEWFHRVKEFASRTGPDTYRRSDMGDDEHKKNIMIGKLAEVAFWHLATNLLEIRDISQPSFSGGIDSEDFILRGYRVDVKSSSMKTKREEYDLAKALKRFNFMVLKDQSPKDIVVQALYPSREQFDCFYFSVWQWVDEVIRNGEDKRIKMNGGFGEYKLLPLLEGKPLRSLKELKERR